MDRCGIAPATIPISGNHTCSTSSSTLNSDVFYADGAIAKWLCKRLKSSCGNAANNLLADNAGALASTVLSRPVGLGRFPQG